MVLALFGAFARVIAHSSVERRKISLAESVRRRGVFSSGADLSAELEMESHSRRRWQLAACGEETSSLNYKGREGRAGARNRFLFMRPGCSIMSLGEGIQTPETASSLYEICICPLHAVTSQLRTRRNDALATTSHHRA